MVALLIIGGWLLGAFILDVAVKCGFIDWCTYYSVPLIDIFNEPPALFFWPVILGIFLVVAPFVGIYFLFNGASSFIARLISSTAKRNYYENRRRYY